MEGGSRKVSSTPENWVIDGRLHWPPPKEVNLKRKKQTPPEEGWAEYECKVLGESFSKLFTFLQNDLVFAYECYFDLYRDAKRSSCERKDL